MVKEEYVNKVETCQLKKTKVLLIKRNILIFRCKITDTLVDQLKIFKISILTKLQLKSENSRGKQNKTFNLVKIVGNSSPQMAKTPKVFHYEDKR